MSKRKIYILFPLTALLLSIVFYFLSPDAPWKHPIMVNRSEQVIDLVDAFIAKNKRLPSSLSEAGAESIAEDSIFYEVTGEAEYVVWFGASLGQSIAYDSSNKRWYVAD